jgi:hypothetical protein
MIVAMLGGAALLPLAPPFALPALSLCAFKSLTGLPCPLCGGTRALQALLRGDFAHAFYLNAAALPALVAIGAIAILLAWEAFRGRAANWEMLVGRLRSLLPMMVTLLCVYWFVHLTSALRGPKPELVDLGNPVARAIYGRFCDLPQ